MHFKWCMIVMEIPTAQAAAIGGDPIHFPQATPTSAEIPCPAITGHGCESWPCGTANSNTALAPIEAISAEAFGISKTVPVIRISSNMDTNPPMPAMSFSFDRVGFSSMPIHLAISAKNR